MKQLPFHLDLCGKTAVVTGGGGVLPVEEWLCQGSKPAICRDSTCVAEGDDRGLRSRDPHVALMGDGDPHSLGAHVVDPSNPGVCLSKVIEGTAGGVNDDALRQPRLALRSKGDQ